MKICLGFDEQSSSGAIAVHPVNIFFSNCSTVSLSKMSEAGLLLPLTFKKDPSLFAHSHSNIFFLLFSQELLLLVAFLQTHAPDSRGKNSFVSLKKSTSNNFFHHKFPISDVSTKSKRKVFINAILPISWGFSVC